MMKMKHLDNIDGRQYEATNKKYWVIVAVCFSFLIVFLFYGVPIHAQETTDILTTKQRFTKIGLQYLFDNGWSDQFAGKIHQINQSAILIEWFKYDDETGFRNETFAKDNAQAFKVEIDFMIYANNTKTSAVFKVYWFNKYDEIIEVQRSEGEIIIRDNTRTSRSWNDIIRYRIYQYEVGGLQ